MRGETLGVEGVSVPKNRYLQSGVCVCLYAGGGGA